VKRLAKTMSISKTAAERIVDKADREQKEFYRKVYGKSEAPAEEFDIIVNFDHLKNAEAMADILASLFALKFGKRSTGR
jgi:cytidylate kinase